MKIRRPVFDKRSERSAIEEVAAFNEISEIPEIVGKLTSTKPCPFN